MSPAAGSYVVSNLKKYTKYEFFVAPFYRSVEGQPSNSKIVQTFEDGKLIVVVQWQWTQWSVKIITSPQYDTNINWLDLIMMLSLQNSLLIFVFLLVNLLVWFSIFISTQTKQQDARIECNIHKMCNQTRHKLYPLIVTKLTQMLLIVIADQSVVLVIHVTRCGGPPVVWFKLWLSLGVVGGWLNRLLIEI